MPGPMEELDTIQMTCQACGKKWNAPRLSTADRRRCPQCVKEKRVK
jgi:hypothetical protein